MLSLYRSEGDDPAVSDIFIHYIRTPKVLLTKMSMMASSIETLVICLACSLSMGIYNADTSRGSESGAPYDVSAEKTSRVVAPRDMFANTDKTPSMTSNL